MHGCGAKNYDSLQAYNYIYVRMCVCVLANTEKAIFQSLAYVINESSVKRAAAVRTARQRHHQCLFTSLTVSSRLVSRLF